MPRALPLLLLSAPLAWAPGQPCLPNTDHLNAYAIEYNRFILSVADGVYDIKQWERTVARLERATGCVLQPK